MIEDRDIPVSTETVENQTSRVRVLKKLYPLILVLGIGTVAFLYGEKCGIDYARDEAVQLLGEEEFDIEIGPSERAQLMGENVSLVTLDEWRATRNSYQQTFNEIVNFNDSEELIKPMRSLAVNHTLYGAELLKMLDENLQIAVDVESLTLRLNDLTFDLAKPLDFHIATAIFDRQINLMLQEAFENENNEATIKEEVRLQVEKSQSELEDLYYLKQKVDNIYFTEEPFLFFPADNLVAIAKITRNLEQHQFPLPKTIMITKTGRDKVGGYIGHESPNSQFTIVLRGNAAPGSVIHEYGHFISDSTNLENDNEKLKAVSLENYSQIVEAVQRFYGSQVKDKKNAYVTEYAMTDVAEDYTDTFAWYFWHGDNLRQKLQELSSTDPAAQVILQAKIDFFKNIFFRGEEFQNEGVSLTDQSKAIVTEVDIDLAEQKFQAGNIVKIEDDDRQNPGILLRLTPGYGLDNKNLPAVFAGDEVEIIEGPKTIIYLALSADGSRIEKKTVNWWKVKISHQAIDSYSLIGNIEGEGWIQERWLGKKVPLE